MTPTGWHVSRGWKRDPFAAECPCGKAPCGFIDFDRIDPDCPQHAMRAAKTIRSSHRAEDCPGPDQPNHKED